MRRALSEFGDPLRWKETGREARGLLWVYDAGGDSDTDCGSSVVRRSLRRPP